MMSKGVMISKGVYGGWGKRSSGGIEANKLIQAFTFMATEVKERRYIDRKPFLEGATRCTQAPCKAPASKAVER
jgi:hypothetical protein